MSEAAKSNRGETPQPRRGTDAGDETPIIDAWTKRMGFYALLGILAYAYIRYNRARVGFEMFKGVGKGDHRWGHDFNIQSWLFSHPGLLLRIVPSALLFIYSALQMRKKLWKTEVDDHGKKMQFSLLGSLLTSLVTNVMDEMKPDDMSHSSGSSLFGRVKLAFECGGLLLLSLPMIPFLLKSNRAKNYLWRHGLSTAAWVPLVARWGKLLLGVPFKGIGYAASQLISDIPFALSCFGHHISALLLGDQQLSQKNRIASWLGWLSFWFVRGVGDYLPWGLFGGQEVHNIVRIALQGLAYFAFAHGNPMVWKALKKVAKTVSSKND